MHDIKIVSSNVVLDLTAQMLSQPLREMLAQELSQALNDAIADLPNQVSVLKRVEIMDMRN